MKKIINKRLEMISAFIEDNESVIDIGCDHGLLGIYLVLNRKKIKVVSSDINIGPLNKAKENLKKYHLEDRIDVRLGDGLDTLSNDIKTIIISGMGGINITSILKTINNYPYINKLILSPNNDFPLVRENISQKGFMLEEEKMVLERGKYYPIMKFVLGKKKISSFFGKLDLDNEVVKKYYINLYNKNKEILKVKKDITIQEENKLIEDNIL